MYSKKGEKEMDVDNEVNPSKYCENYLQNACFE